jgi:hypothetical protein
MNNPPQASRIGRRHRRGVALITTLSLMSLLAILLVSFMVLVKDDRARSKSFLDSVRARSFLEIGAQEAISKIMDGFEDPALAITSSGRQASVTATPGLIEIRYFFKNPWRHNNATGTNAFGSSETPTWPTNIYNNNQTPYFRNPFLPNYGGQDANPRWVPLFSWRYFAPGIRNLRIDPGGGSRSVVNPDYNPAAVFNFNTIQNPFYPGELYLSGSPERSVAMRTARVTGSGTSKDRASGGSVGVMNSYRLRPGEASIDRPLYVQWIPVLEHPGRPPGPTNRVIGRYAYWVDVENSKVNLATSTRNYDGSKIHVMTGKNDYEEAFVNDTTLLAQTNPTYANDGKSREARRKLEARTIAFTFNNTNTNFYNITKSNGNDPANEALPVYYTNWFAWDGNNRPMAADNSMVHWRTFTGMRPATATNISIEGLSAQYAALASGGTRLNTFGEFASYIDPLGATNALTNRLIFSTLRRGHGISTTIYGRDDERDLIGLPRISIVDFQRSINSVSDIASSDLYQRLTNPLYYRALYPNNYINGGTNRSLIDTLAPFSGAGTGATADGEIALQQMLLNIAESSRPFNEPPLQDLSRGLIGAKSMPYVAEVGTRVRSAVITLPQSKWVTNTFIETAIVGTNVYYRPRSAPEANTDGISKPAYAWLTNVVVDLAIGFVNPNPWATHVFAGPDQLTLHLRYDYRQDGGGLTTGATISSNISPVSTYAALPLPSRGTNGRSDGRHRGVAAVGSLMVFSRLAGSQYLLTDSGTLTNSTPLGSLTPLQIRGWDIRKGAAIFHRVPLPHPTAVPYTPPDWCDMADPGRNVGMTNIGGLGLYQADGRKVGWITRSSHNMNPNNLRKIIYTNPEFLTTTSGDTNIAGNAYFAATNTNWIAYTEALTNILSGLTNPNNGAALVERVQASDPTLGHRTGNTNITLTNIHGVAGPVRGHFYGALGHPWRHSEWPGTPGTPDLKSVQIRIGTTTNTIVSTVTNQVPVGLGFANQVITVTNIILTPIYTTVDQLVFPETPGAFNLGLTDRFRNATMGEPLNPGANIPQYVMKGPPIVEPRIANERLDKEYSGLLTNTFQIQDPGASGLSATTPTVGLLINGSGGAHEDTRNYMTSIGQVGFIHSGLLNRHIRFTDAAVNNTNKLNSFRNGPPLSILLDILSPGAFQDNDTGDFSTKTQWASGTRQNTPASPRRGTWNINTAIAHDNYLAIREGSPDPRNNNIQNVGTRVALVPTAQAGWVLRQSPQAQTGYRFRDDEVLDRFLNPYLLFRRGIESWIGIVCGDVTPGNYFGFGAFNGFNPAATTGVNENAFGRVSAGRFSWNPGIGVDPVDNSEWLVFAEFDPTQSTVLSRLLHLGQENQDGNNNDTGRNNFEGSFPFAADRGGISGSLTNKTLSSIDRFGYFELEHSVGSAAAKFAKLNTLLNPDTIVRWNWPNNQESIQNGPAGAEATQGMMENTAVALLSNQITTSANAFTIHVVAQALQDNPFRKRKKLDGTDDINTGLGYMDVDDKVVAEQWGQIVVARYDPEFANAHKPALELSGNVTNNVYRVLYYRVLDNPK